MKTGVRYPMQGVVYPSASVLRQHVEAGVLGHESLAAAYVDAFERHAQRPAIVGSWGTMTYGQLDERSDRLAAALMTLGAQPRESALFQLANTPSLVVAVVACLKIGVIPICTLTSHRELEIGALGRHAGAALWFVQGDDAKFDLRAFANRLRAQLPSVREIVVADGEPLAGQHGLDALVQTQDPRWARPLAREATAALDPFQVAIFQLSGGTTGVSKLIPRLSNEYLYNMRAVLRASGRAQPDACYCGGPFLHNAGFVIHWGPTLLIGGTLVMGKDLDGDALHALFEQHRPSWAYLPKPLLIRLVDAMHAVGRPIRGVKTVMTSAASDYVQRELGARGLNIYGMAEGIVMMPTPDDGFEVIDRSVGRAVSPLDEVRIVDPETLADVADGQSGEMLVRGPTTLHGYFRADERNRASFTADGFLRTGDLMQRFVIDGRACYAFKGRLKDVIKRAGESVSCDELERALRDYPGIADVAVVGVPDTRYGERACACLVLKAEAASPSVQQLGRHFETLGFAKYKWPEFVHVTAAFPLTPSGKLSKPLLREQAAAAIAPRSTS